LFRNVPRQPGEISHYFTTPLHGSQTPSYGAFGSRTPMIGNQTPMHDGSRTPHYGNMVCKQISQTKKTSLNLFRHLVMMVQRLHMLMAVHQLGIQLMQQHLG
jgi:hypothetical protein